MNKDKDIFTIKGNAAKSGRGILFLEPGYGRVCRGCLYASGL